MVKINSDLEFVAQHSAPQSVSGYAGSSRKNFLDSACAQPGSGEAVNDHKTVSMQESTTGAVDLFLSTESLQCLPSFRLLSYLAGALQRYEEEGVLLNPRVILCSSIDDFAKPFPGGKYIKVGETSYVDDCGKRILKECATLARDGWVIYVQRDSVEKISFGVFSFFASPTSIDLRNMIAMASDGAASDRFNSVLIERLDPKTVLMTGASGGSLQVAFSTTRKATDDSGAVSKFAAICSSECAVEGFADYFCAFFQRALSDSHGTIVVCLPKGSISAIDGMADAITFEPPIDLAKSSALIKTPTPPSRSWNFNESKVCSLPYSIQMVLSFSMLKAERAPSESSIGHLSQASSLSRSRARRHLSAARV